MTGPAREPINLWTATPGGPLSFSNRVSRRATRRRSCSGCLEQVHRRRSFVSARDGAVVHQRAWGAFERVMEVRDRLSASELSVDRLDPALVRLVCRLTDAIQQADRDGTARIIDFNAGPGDLPLSVADALRDDQEAHVTACCPDPYVARLVRRRLTVRDLQEDGFDVRSDPAGALEGANVIIGQCPYRPGEDRSEGFDPEAHSRTYAISTLIRDVVRSPLPLTPRYLPAEHEFATEIPRAGRQGT